jgi:magnesium transporter
VIGVACASLGLQAMKTPVVPSTDVLRFLQHQTETIFPCSSSSISTLRAPCRRHLSTSSPKCAKHQQTFIDDLWPRHRDAHAALPAPRGPPPSPPRSRHASNATQQGWLRRIFRHQQAAAQAAKQASKNAQHSVPFENQSYEDTSAQLFNLSRALSRNPSGADLKLRCTEFDSNGSVTLVAGEFKKSELIAKYGLLPRDLRKIDSSVLPHILVRPSAILINLLHLRVLIQSDRVLVFDAYGSTDSYTQSLFMYDLEGKLRQKADPRAVSSNSYLPYEFRALEAVLISVTSGLEAEFALVRDPVTHILRELEEDIDREKLRHLLIHSKKLGTFEQKARLVRDAIDDLLNADDDLAAMYLTNHKSGKPRVENDHQEVEMLLESYHKICDEIVEISGNLISNIRNTEEVVKAILDANRNQLMLLDLKFSIGTLGLAGGTLIAGLYGMNLENFIEETNYGFGAVTVTCFALTGVIFVAGMRKLRKIQKVRMWGEGIDSFDRHGRQRGRSQRGNWMSEALESQAWQTQLQRKSMGINGHTGPVLWPGMEGLGMHKMHEGVSGDAQHVGQHSQSVDVERQQRREAARARVANGPAVTIHDDLDQRDAETAVVKAGVKTSASASGNAEVKRK